MGDLLRIGRQGEPLVVALIAHDGKKADLLALAGEYQMTLRGIALLATGTTGKILIEEIGLPVERTASGPEGGDLQIAARISHGEVSAVVFLRDPLTAHPHEPDIQALMKVCDIYSVPIATNLASARILLEHLDRQRAPERMSV